MIEGDGHRPGMSWLERVETLAETAAACLILIAAALVFLGIVLRNVFGVSPSWIVEAPVYAVVWGVFLALGNTFNRGLHLGLDILVRRLPWRVQRGLAVFGSVAMLLIAGALLWTGLGLTLQQYAIGAVSNTALRMPLFAVSAAVPAGCAFLLLRATADIVARSRRAQPRGEPTDQAGMVTPEEVT